MALLEIYQDSRSPGRCRSCGAAVEFAVVVKSGNRIPLNAGVVVVRAQPGLLDARIIETIDTAISPSHFVTCPQAPQWRKGSR